MKKVRFEKVVEGAWIQPVNRGYLMACCDCSLVHKMNFRVKNGRVQIQAFRMDGHTRMWRKKNRIRVTTGPVKARRGK